MPKPISPTARITIDIDGPQSVALKRTDKVGKITTIRLADQDVHDLARYLPQFSGQLVRERHKDVFAKDPDLEIQPTVEAHGAAVNTDIHESAVVLSLKDALGGHTAFLLQPGLARSLARGLDHFADKVEAGPKTKN
jgi:hypothetical protein